MSTGLRFFRYFYQFLEEGDDDAAFGNPFKNVPLASKNLVNACDKEFQSGISYTSLPTPLAQNTFC